MDLAGTHRTQLLEIENDLVASHFETRGGTARGSVPRVNSTSLSKHQTLNDMSAVDPDRVGGRIDR